MVGVAVRANRQYIVASRWEHPLNAQTKNNYTAIVVYCLYYLGTTQQVLRVHGVALPHGDIFLLHRPFQARSRGGVQTKTSEGGRGYVIIFNNEPSCCYVATSERRRIRLKADYHCFALRGASIRRSQRSNSEAVLFRWVLPRRYSIRRSQRGNNSATP